MWLAVPLLALMLSAFTGLRRHIRFVVAASVIIGALGSGLFVSQLRADDEIFVLIFMLLPAALLLNGGILLFARRRRGEARELLNSATGGLVLAALMSGLVLVLWSVSNIGLIVFRARAIVGDGPFCIQVGERSSYREVTHWGQLLGHRMLIPFASGGGSEEYQFNFHALLVVPGASGFYNWSYWSRTFMPTRGDGLFIQVSCTPKEGFFDTLL